jgi:Bacterial Ig-like domain (group 3)/FG-GAP-like repeat
MRFSPLLCFPALTVPFFLISFCAIAAAQSPVTISLALNSPTQPAATATTATVTVADSAGPIRFGMVDILDGTQKVQTLQLVSTSGSGFTPGTAILRHIFAPGSHQLTAAFHATTADAAANSSPVALTVTPGTYTSTSALRYAQTIDFSVNDSYNVLADVVVADFNNDGIPDIASVQGYPNALAVSLADKPGHFLPPTNLPITSNNDSTFIRVLAADLDADGLVDLIVTGPGDDYTVFFRNNPAAPGTFLAPTELIPGKGTPIVIADFNHDGLPDIAYIQGNALFTNPSNITVALNQQSAPGTFPISVTSSSFSGYDVVDLKTADMNGDGFPDLVLRCAPSYNGNTPPSDDTWESIVFLDDPAHPGQFLAPAVFTPPATMNSIVVQDLNHDGLPDVVVSGKGSYFSVYLGDPAHPGQSLAPQNTTAPGNLTYLYTVAIGDVDGDGIPDVIATDEGNTLLIFPGKGDGTFLAATTLFEGLTAPAWGNSATVLADLDGDGLSDLVTTEYAQNSAQIFLHNTQVIAPTLQTATDLTVSPSITNIASGIPITFTVTETASSGQPTGSVDLFDFVAFPPFKLIATLPLVSNTATFTTSSLAVGVHEPVAVFHGNSIYAPSQSAGAVLNILQSQSATIQLTAAPNPATFGQTVTLRAVLTGSYGTPTGSVTFLDSGQNIGTATLANGVASFTTSTLAVGSHNIQVSYSGNYPSQTSTSITVTITGAPDFSLSLSSTTATITHGSTATTTISLTPLNGFSAATSLTCTGAPTNSTCSISSPSVTPAGAAATATLTLQTSIQSASLTPGRSPLNPGASTPIVAGTLPLGLLALLSARRRRVGSATARPRHLICGESLFLAVSLLASLVSVVACGGSSGGGGSAGPQTLYPTAGTYPLTVTATSGATIHTTTFTVTIQ